MASHELQPFIHDRTLLPRHDSLPNKRRKCHPCVRYDVLPMFRPRIEPMSCSSKKAEDCLVVDQEVDGSNPIRLGPLTPLPSCSSSHFPNRAQIRVSVRSVQ